jgi:5'-nucleotidase/UDP-sugar diphosphatase
MSALRRFAVGVLIALLCVGSAGAETAHVTFLLVNDIYLIADQMMPDGKRRGGFARLAAVVKAERAKGNVILAHAGDTLSPSLMSGLDRGAHILALTNLIAPDIFTPGNHEFDFGKATSLERMGEAKFPLYAANLRSSDGAPLPNFKDRAIVTVDGVRIGLTGATYDDTSRISSPEDLKFLPTVATTKDAAEALRRDGADFIVAIVHASREQDAHLRESGNPGPGSPLARMSAKLASCRGCGAARNEVERCAADPGPPRTVTIHASRACPTCSHLSADLG